MPTPSEPDRPTQFGRDPGSGLSRRQVLNLGAVGGAALTLPRFGQSGAEPDTVAQPIFSFTGGVTEKGALCNTMLVPRHAGKAINLAVSTDPQFRQYQLAGWRTADGDAIARHEINGLSSDTVYYAQVVSEGSRVGRVLRFKTMPNWGASFQRTIAVVSCQSNAGDRTGTQLAWADIVDWRPDDIFHLGDFGYWGGQLDPRGPYTQDLKQYAQAMARMQTMATALQNAGLNAVTISDHEISANGDPPAGIHNSPESIRELIAFQKLFPVRKYGDFRSPRRGRFYSYDIGSAIRVIVTDFRSPDRSNNTDPDGPAKTMFGATQLQWIFDNLSHSRVNLLVNETSWLADGDSGRRSGDKPWSYLYEQNVIANRIKDRGYQVAWIGGDRHYVGYLSGATGSPHNTRGDFPCYISSGTSKYSLRRQAGEVMTWQFGADFVPDRPVCGYMRITLGFDAGSGQVTMSGVGRAVLNTKAARETWHLQDIPSGTAFDSWQLR